MSVASSSEVDDATLVARARQDPDAFGVLFRRHVDDVHRFVRRRVVDEALADDLTATTFERCWRSLSSFRPRRDTMLPWLLRIAANEVASHFRSEQRRRARELRAVGREPSVVAGAVDEPEIWDAALLAALGGLDRKHQIVLSLRFLADLSTPDAAAAMHVTPRHFAVMQYRALAALRRELERGGTT